MTRTYSPDPNRMPEAEVTLRLAFYLLRSSESPVQAELAIDPSCVGPDDNPVFYIHPFLDDHACLPLERKLGAWRGDYQWCEHKFSITSKGGFDILVQFRNKKIAVECKGKKNGLSEKQTFEAAIGQIITSQDSSDIDEYWVAVPNSQKFSDIGESITRRKLFARTGIKLVLVGTDGEVTFLN